MYLFIQRRMATVLRKITNHNHNCQINTLSVVSAAVSNLALSRTRDLGNAFAKWKAIVIIKHTEKIIARMTHEQIYNQFLVRLTLLYLRRLRIGLRRIGARASIVAMMRRSLMNAQLVQRKGLISGLQQWRQQSALKIQRDDIVSAAEKVLLLPGVEKIQANILRTPLRYAFTRLRFGPRGLIEKVMNLAESGLRSKQQQVIRILHRQVVALREHYLNLHWKWKVAQIAYRLGKNLTNQQKCHLGITLISRIASQAANRRHNDVFSKLKYQSCVPVLNMWRIIERGFTVCLHKAWNNWTKDMYRERALDWEENFNTVLHMSRLFKHICVYQERQRMTLLVRVIRRWKCPGRKALVRVLSALRSSTYATIHNFMLIWQLKAKMQSRTRLSCFMMDIHERLITSKHHNLASAFHIWDTSRHRLRKIAAVRHVIDQQQKKLSSYLQQWDEIAYVMKQEHLKKVLLTWNDLDSRINQRDSMSLKNAYDRWVKNNPKVVLQRAVDRMIYHWHQIQRLALGRFSKAVQNSKLMDNAVAACKLLAYSMRARKKLLREAIRRWHAREFQRRRDVLRKYMITWMNLTHIGYQQAFWRWMFLTKGS